MIDRVLDVSIRLIASFALFCSVSSGQEPRVRTPGGLEITAELLQTSPDGPVVKVVLQNKSRSDVAIRVGDLPWVNDSIVTLGVVTMPEGAPLRRVYPFTHPKPGKAVIRSGKSLEGRIFLTRHFADLAVLGRKSALLVSWSIPVTVSNGDVRSSGAGVLSVLRSNERERR
jgi:hypothetical protein